jgi:hypothetical protein
MSALSSSSAFCVLSVQQKGSDFFNSLYKGSAVESCEAPHEPLHIFNVPDMAHFSDGRNLVKVRIDAALDAVVPQELALGDSEGAFLRVQLNVEPPDVVVTSLMLKHFICTLVTLVKL